MFRTGGRSAGWRSLADASHTQEVAPRIADLENARGGRDAGEVVHFDDRELCPGGRTLDGHSFLPRRLRPTDVCAKAGARYLMIEEE